MATCGARDGARWIQSRASYQAALAATLALAVWCGAAEPPTVVGKAPGREAVPVRLGDGTLRIYYLAEETGRDAVAVIESRDGGRNWSGPAAVLSLEGRHWVVRPLAARDGTVHLFLLRWREGRKFLDVWHTRSRDGSGGWAEPQRIFDGYVGSLRGAAELRSFGLDETVVVAIGGGSALDAAKAISLAAANERPVWELEYDGDDLRPGRPIIAVPTTAGTGSEAHPFGVITRTETGRKDYVGHRSLLPVATILDPGLTIAMPPAVTAATGVDALTHSLESLLSRNPNPFAEGMALQVIRTVRQWLPSAVTDGADLEARAQLLVASHLAGHAIRRRVDSTGAISLYNRNYYIGVIHRRKDVYVMFDPEVRAWVVADEEGRQLSRQAAREISRESIMGLTVTHRR